LQPRSMVIGQITEPFFIEPTGHVNTFAISFYPFGFANFVDLPISSLANTETPIAVLFGEKAAAELEQRIINADGTETRIKIIEQFLLTMLDKESTIDVIVKETIDALLSSNGGVKINSVLADEPAKRRQLERKFRKQIGISPKQLGKVIRLQAALKLILADGGQKLTDIAYQSDYYDQSHFVKDFKEFTGVNPKGFLEDKSLALSSLFYK